MILEATPFGRVVIPSNVPRGVALFYTTRDFDGRLNDSVAQSLMRFTAEQFGVEATLNTCSQVHGTAAHLASRGDRWRECDTCDALLTAERGVALGIKVADCLPVTMVDSHNEVVADIHSGWRGALHGVTSATLDALRSGTSFDPARATAWIGPSIRACCFEVGEEVVTAFTASFDDAERWIDRSHTRPHVDLAGLTSDVLLRAGIPPERIIDTQLCTRCEGSIFHSFRRERGTGRNLAIVAQ